MIQELISRYEEYKKENLEAVNHTSFIFTPTLNDFMTWLKAKQPMRKSAEDESAHIERCLNVDGRCLHSSEPPEPIPAWEERFYDEFGQAGVDSRFLKINLSPTRVISFIASIGREAEKRGTKQDAEDMVAVGLKAVERARAEERKRIFCEIKTLKRWVATLSSFNHPRADEYVVRDIELKALEASLSNESPEA